jgi:hydrogenase maturation protease
MVNKKEVLVFGIGNEILTDDAIGPKLVKDLESSLDLPNVEFETAALGGLEVLEFIQGYRKVILIDAIKTKDGIPGDVYLFTLDDFKETLHLSNLHDISFLTAIKLGNKLGFEMPKDMKVIAIEIIEDLVFSNDFTEPLQKRYQEIYKDIKIFLTEYAKTESSLNVELK